MDGNLSSKGVFRNINEVIPFLGPFGRYQRLLTVIFCVMILPTTHQILIMYFGALSPEWRCAANSTLCTQNETFPETNKDMCAMARGDWEFTEPPSYSIRTQFDIYCDKEWIIHLTTSVFFCGWAIGAVVLGWTADNYGRKIVLFPSIMVVIFVGFVSAFSPNIIVFITCRFIIGFFIPGTGVQMVVLLSEFVTTKYRPAAVAMICTFFSVGLCLLGVEAYFIRDWKLLFIVSSTPYVFVIMFYKVVPESIRWLHLHGKIDQLINVFHKIGHWNRKPIPSDFTILPYQNRGKCKAGPLDLFKTRKMAMQSIIQGYAWMVSGMVYYGLSLTADELGGSLYTNFILLSAVELPANLITMYLCERVGRRKTTSGTMFFCSVACTAIAFAPKTGRTKLLLIVFGIIGKCCITISFSALYTWSVEIYPTDIRSQGIGFLQIASRLGAASSPWISKGLKFFRHVSPFVLMGGLSLMSAVLLVFLPETKGVPTPDSSTGEETAVETMENCGLMNEEKVAT